MMIALQEAGLKENTIVVFISDHGDWLGDHGLILKGPMHYEGLLRVPMIWNGPGVPEGKVIEDPVSTLDLPTTFMALGEVQPQLTQHGSNIFPVVQGKEGREFALNEWELLPTRAGVALSLQTVRTKTHKMTVDAQSGAGELYDLAADPHELNNVFDDPAYAQMRANLQAMIDSRPDDRTPTRTQVGMA